MEAFVLGGAVAVWAAIHSWLASQGMKDRIAQALGSGAERAYRLAYNVFAVVSFAPIGLLMRSLPDRVLYKAQPPLALVLLGGQAIAVVLLVLAVLQTDTLHFAGLAQLLGRRSAPTLITTGFYRWVRHPLYLFGLIILWLTPLLTVNLLAVMAVLTAYLFVGAKLEEQRLLREFGAAYEEYRRRTPMIIPGLRLGSGAGDRMA